ncbi:hypothetical protein ACFCZT_07820 [Streptomyces sp. NPDC056230]|uniref:hypothetical protein n=1 Tax=Streptomyces sp. NPDC056230 TaxID=3345754 RepID=UPI0035D9266C
MSFEPGQMVEILSDGKTNFAETFGKFLPKGEVIETLPNGRVNVQPGTVAYPLRTYCLFLLPEHIRPIA